MRMSGKIVLMGIGLMAFTGARAAGGDSATLQRLIEAYFDGVASKSFVKLDSVVTRDFSIYENGKVWNNDSVFHNIQYNQPFSVKFTLTDFHIFTDTRSGEARYHSRADFVVRDTVKFTLNFLETATFRKTGAGWKISLIHVTAETTPEVGMPHFYRTYDTVRYIREHYRERIDAFSTEQPHLGGIVILGNSITEFGDWKRLLKDSGAVNRGIAGDNTFGMLDRLAGVIELRPRKLIVEAGINDIGQGVPIGMIAGNIASIVEYVRVKSPGTRVYVVSVLPTNDHARQDYPEIAGKNEVATQLDLKLREGAAKYEYTYVDLASEVTAGSGNLDERYSKPDGLHLNEAGYDVLVRLIKKL
jgi:lysophospholipase L1-like esterase